MCQVKPSKQSIALSSYVNAPHVFDSDITGH